MSNVSGTNLQSQSDFEYWEFVHCAVCFLPFVPDPTNAPNGPPSVPFWLTECGHTVCNNHLNADQSCASCRAPSIQLVPLQREMMPPMSDWFRSIPHALDALASAAKFQQESMASLVRFYKRKYLQQRAALSKTKEVIAENKALRSQMQQLQEENAQLRTGVPPSQHFDQRFAYTSNRQTAVDEALSYEPSDSRNTHGKRPLSDANQHHRTSSPRSVITPLGPQRLTLPPDHQQPIFPSGMNANEADASRNGGVPHPDETNARPGSSRFEQYAYHPPGTPYRPQPLRYHQQPQEQRRQQQAQEVHQVQQVHSRVQQGRPQDHSHQQQQQKRHMPPPPTPSRNHESVSQHQTHARAPFQPTGQAATTSVRRSQMQMPPPPGTRQPRPAPGRQPQPFPMSVPSPAPVLSSRAPSAASRTSTAIGTHSAPSDRSFTVPPTPSNRFFPVRAAGGTSAGPSKAQTDPEVGSGGRTRAPFVPGMGARSG